MIRNVIKRDNSVVAFDSSKVYDAIIKAMYSSGFVDIEIAETISQEIGNYYAFKGVETITIKEIESLVYNMLIKWGIFMNDLNMNSLKIFLEVANSNSFLEASNKLYVSQPAISKSMSKLEEDLNVTLFYRANKGI